MYIKPFTSILEKEGKYTFSCNLDKNGEEIQTLFVCPIMFDTEEEAKRQATTFFKVFLENAKKEGLTGTLQSLGGLKVHSNKE